MKMTVDNAQVNRGGCVRRERRFNMKATAKSFQILSAGIYTDHIAAILRELGCNAADSHTAAGKPDVPIRVHLPNSLEPFLAIEDDGIGLDDIEIRGQYVCPNCDHTENSDFDSENCPECGCKLSEANFEPGIYTTYFDSDKTDDEDLTGCLGLGSKTPMAYTDQFGVVAVKDGTRNIYSAFLDEQKMPAIVRLHTETTTDPNGVRVEMAVNPDDFDKFVSKAGYVYQWFTTTPELSGVTDFVWPEDQTFLMETDDYAIVDKGFDAYSAGGGTAVLMGNVRYQLEFSDFDYKTRSKFTEVETMLLKHGVTLKVSLAEGCDVAASREKLQMTARSVETIKRKLALAEADCLVEVQKRIDDCTTIWDARLKYGELMSKTILGAIAKKSKVDPLWMGRDCNPFVSFITYEEIEQLVYPRDDSKLLDGESDEDSRLPGPPQLVIKKRSITMAKGISCFLRSPQRRTNRFGEDPSDIFDKTHGLEGFKIESNVRIFVQDVTHGSYAAVERFLRENLGVNVYLVVDVEEYDLQTFLDDTGLSEVTELVSTLPKPDRATRGLKKQKKTAKAVRFVGGRHDSASYCWEDHTIEDLDEGGVYVEVHRYSWRAGKLCGGDGTYHEPRLLKSHMTNARKIDPNLGHVIGMRKALVEKVANNPNWVRLDQHIINCIVAQAELADNAVAYGVWLAVNNDSHYLHRIIDMLGELDWATNSKVGSLLRETLMFRNCGTREVKAFRENRNQYGYLVDEHLDDDGVDYTSVIDDLKRQWKTLWDNYPMMAFVEWGRLNGRDDRLQRVIDYINAVDGYTPKVTVEVEDDAAEAA